MNCNELVLSENKREETRTPQTKEKTEELKRKDVMKIKDSTIHDNPTDTIDIKGEKINERSVRYPRRKDVQHARE